MVIDPNHAKAPPHEVLASPEQLRASFDDALARRASIASVTTAYRLVDDAADGCPGLTVDRYDDWAVLSVLDDRPSDRLAVIARALVATGVRGVYLKRRLRGDLRRRAREEVAPRGPFTGEAAPAELTVSEHGMLASVSLDDGLSTGLFTDQRDNRQAVRAMSRGARMLNLFSYTCTFTVAAALGGAAETVSVDLSRRALDRGRSNLALNGVLGPQHRLVHEDAVSFTARQRRRGPRFDVIVLDPPSFGSRARGAFSVDRDYPALPRDACWR